MKIKKEYIGLIVVGLALLAILGMWYFREFDAQGYVQAVLNQRFYGDAEAAVIFVDDKTEEELIQQYEMEIQSFVESNITAGVEMGEELKGQYVEICKQIFNEMDYSVKEAKKINRNEYHVPVEYNPVDVFQTFSAAVPEEKAKIEDKVEKGEYKGTKEEITEQIQQEYLYNCCELLKTAHEEMKYAETETIVFVVKRNADDLFAIDEVQMHEFLVKIMGLDIKQD